MRKYLIWGLYGVIVCTVLVGAGIVAGFQASEALNRPESILARIHVRLASLYNSSFKSGEAELRTLRATHVTLTEETVSLPLDATYYAGGITAFQGTSVLVLDRLGRFFHVHEGETEVLSLAPPDNGVVALRSQFEAGKFGRAEVDFKWFRYNDILHMGASGQQWLLVSFTEWHPDDFCFTSTMARLDLPESAAPGDWQADAKDWRVITRTAPCLPPNPYGHAIKGLEAGGRMVARDVETVIWSSGAYERDDAYPNVEPLAQNDSTDYGKILRVDLETGNISHIAKGLRNPQGLAIDASGTIWTTDHGMRAGDELNRVSEGANFGWPVVTYGTRYNTQPAGAFGFHAGHAGFDKPMIAFVPGIAPGSAIALEGFHYAWDGDILVGAFRGDLYRVRVEDDRVLFSEKIEVGVRPRDMVMLEDGRFAVWTDFRQVRFYRAVQGPNPIEPVIKRLTAIPLEDLRLSAESTLDQCLACHALQPGDHGAGPSLAGICDAVPGATDFADYSRAMTYAGGRWTTDRLAAFIRDPQSVVPGTTMPWGQMGDTEAATTVAEALCPR